MSRPDVKVGATLLAFTVFFEKLCRLFVVILLFCPKERLEKPLALQDAIQAELEPVRRKRFNDIVVGNEFNGSDDLFVGLLGGDHHEHRLVGQHAHPAQLLQQMLPGTPVA
jgi:hypothetical protein